MCLKTCVNTGQCVDQVNYDTDPSGLDNDKCLGKGNMMWNQLDKANTVGFESSRSDNGQE